MIDMFEQGDFMDDAGMPNHGKSGVESAMFDALGVSKE